MDARDAMGPLEFQFGAEDDQAKYGDRWFRYDESSIMRLPARTLIELEARMGIPVAQVMNEMRAGSMLGDTAAAWIGVRLVDPGLAGPFDDFNPLSLMIKWEKASGKADAGPVMLPPPAEPEPVPDSEPVLLDVSPTLPTRE
jgi:hypothetical protein